MTINDTSRQVTAWLSSGRRVPLTLAGIGLGAFGFGLDQAAIGSFALAPATWGMVGAACGVAAAVSPAVLAFARRGASRA
jgi:hypothetical protein